jgi:hypothetical protein
VTAARRNGKEIAEMVRLLGLIRKQVARILEWHGFQAKLIGFNRTAIRRALQKAGNRTER